MINSLNKKVLIAISLFVLCSCSSDNDFTSEEQELSSDYIISDEVLESEDSEDYFEDAELVSSDPSIDGNYSLEDMSTSYQYDDRTGAVGDYTYNYDISGQDSFGDEVVGNIDISGKYGNGTITDSEGDEKNVDVEWTDYGVLEATDDYGNTYEMEVQ